MSETPNPLKTTDLTGAFIHDLNNVFGAVKAFRQLNMMIDYSELTEQALKFGKTMNRYPRDGDIPRKTIVEFFGKVQSEGLSASNIDSLSAEFDEITSGLNGK